MSDNDAEMQANGQAEFDDDGECFVIAPIGSPQSETRKRTDGLLDEAIRPVVEEELNLTVIAPHEIAEAGSITRQVIQRLLEAELVVADLTNLNANVMYELAVRHAKGEPVVPIAEKGTMLPFDITTERTVFYQDSMHGLKELKPTLEDAARAALGDEEPDNPIYRAQQDFQVREATAGDDAMQYVMDRLDEIESVIGSSENKRPNVISVGGAKDKVEYDFEAEPTQLVDVIAQLSVQLPEGAKHTIQMIGSEKWHLTVRVHPEDTAIVRDLVESIADRKGIEFIASPFPF